MSVVRTLRLAILTVAFSVTLSYLPSTHAQEAADPALVGAIDVHAHMGPDSQTHGPRALDIVDMAKLAKARGMRGFVVKFHTTDTSSLAAVVRKVVPGVEVYGAIALNRGVGGINPEAVRLMARTTGGWGRIVWMPSFEAEDAVKRSSNKNAPFVPATRNGELLPEVKEVLDIIAKTRTADSNGELVLATSHLSPEESLLLLREARDRGVKHMVVTHAAPAGRIWSLAQMQEAVTLGAFIEFVAARLFRDTDAESARATVDTVRKVGVEHWVFSSDLGQQGLPLPPDGLGLKAQWLRNEGFTDRELTVMMKENPARLLGLPLQ